MFLIDLIVYVITYIHTEKPVKLLSNV